MKQQLLSLLTRTPLHVGAGNSVGAIDSPVMRERHTRIPIVPGSSLKGVLADLWQNDPQHDELFGKMNQAGKLLIGEARVLAFPLRSGRGSFAWITSPLALQRFMRDAQMKIKLQIPALKDQMDCAAGSQVILNGRDVVLEEYRFNHLPSETEKGREIAAELKKLSDDPVWQALENRLVIVQDELFSYFVENACEIVTRIRIDDALGTVEKGALFNQEQVPSETLLYAVIAEQSEGCLEQLAERLKEKGNQLQLGGDETIGLGYCSTKLM